MFDLTGIKQLLHDGLKLARQRIASEGGFTPFAIALVGKEYNVMESINNDGAQLDDVIDAFKEGVNTLNIDAFLCCVDGKIKLPEEGISMNAILVALESGDQFIRCYQLYGKDKEGELVFTPLEVSDESSIAL